MLFSRIHQSMIDLVLNEEDRRIKYIVPTKETHRYFAQLGFWQPATNSALNCGV
jgi:hypothetical protein